MALKVTAELVITGKQADALLINIDPQTAAHEVANFLHNALGNTLGTEGLVVRVQETKKDGTPKKNAQVYSTDNYSTDTVDA